MKKAYAIVLNGEFVTPINDRRYTRGRDAERIATLMNKKEQAGYKYMAAYIGERLAVEGGK